MKIKEEFPITLPRLIEGSGLNRSLALRLMPKPDRMSGKTPRWRKGWMLPKHGAALLLRDKMPEARSLAGVGSAEAIHVIAVFDLYVDAKAVIVEFAAAYWSIPSRALKTWLSECARKKGGLILS